MIEMRKIIDSNDNTAQEDLYIGREVGNYRIQRVIASGSFGTVYLACHLHLRERTAALKMLHTVHLGSAKEKRAFLHEADILERLKHCQHILPLHDVGFDGNVPYMVTEYAERGSLRMRMQRRDNPMSFLDVLTIIKQVGQGLQNAHDCEIVHRDLSPENILFNVKDEALLADFGIATILSNATVRHSRVVGTPAYMAPEQFRGEICKENDQYALACIAYELLTGRQLFEAQNVSEMAYLHTSQTPIPPRQLNPHIPMSVEDTLLKALSKQRIERYPSIIAFVASLTDVAIDYDDRDVFLAEQGISAAPKLPPTAINSAIIPYAQVSSTAPTLPPTDPAAIHLDTISQDEKKLVLSTQPAIETAAVPSTANTTLTPVPVYPGGSEPASQHRLTNCKRLPPILVALIGTLLARVRASEGEKREVKA